MSDVQFIFVVLGALYAWECACWVRRGGVVFGTWLGRCWRIQHPAVMLGNQSGGFIFAAPLPPLGEIFCAHQFPFSIGPAGVLCFVSANVNPGWRPAQNGCFLSWDEVGQLQLRGKKLQLHQKKIFGASTTTLARYIFDSLTEIAGASASAREVAIEKLLRTTLDTRQIETLRSEFDQQIRPIRWFANVLLIFMFVLAPLLVSLIGLKIIWAWLLLALAVLTVTTAWLFARIHRKFYPLASDDRFTQTLIIALAPATTLRAHDIASRPLLERFHPLAVAKVFLQPEHFRRFARRLLLDLRNPARPTCPSADPVANATEFFFRSTQLKITEAWLMENKIAPADLCQPPAPADESCRAYCPRCESQFTTADGFCADCGELPLAPFRKPS